MSGNVTRKHAGWIGVDFDSTLATYDRWEGPEVLGTPIASMVARVKQWLSEGIEVRVFIARVYAPANEAQRQGEAALATLAIQRWCFEHLGQVLPITCQKDFGMWQLWDDRAVQVVPNTGERVDGAQ